MTIDEFNTMIDAMAMDRMSLARYSAYLQHETREDKYLREEYLSIQAVVRHKGYHGDTTIELGDEREKWDARVGGVDLFEVVQALPKGEHVIRKSIAGSETRVMLPVNDPEAGEPTEEPAIDSLARFLTQLDHAQDHLQFPDVIIKAIDKKHAKKYADERSLIVVFDGDYSFEEDENVYKWIEEIRRRAHRGAFKEILLVELARRKVFPLF